MTAKIVRRSFLGGIGASIAGLFGSRAGGAKAERMAVEPTAASPTSDPIQDFLAELHDLWRRHAGRPGFQCHLDVRKEVVTAAPIYDPGTDQHWIRLEQIEKWTVNLAIIDEAKAARRTAETN